MRIRGRLSVVAAVAAGLAVVASGAEWRHVTGPPELELPRDHGAHPEFRTEWWYLTGLVESGSGQRYGFQLTFFRQGLAPGTPTSEESPLRARQVLAAHLAVADIGGATFVHAERLRRADDGLAGFATDDLALWLDDWSLARLEDGRVTARARDVEGGIGLALELRPIRPFVRHGDDGYSQKGPEPGNASAYLSWTRLAVKGELELSGRKLPVSGAAWFDHEWGTSQLGEGVAGWDWFSLRLDDGRDLMLYQLRHGDGSADRFSAGTVVGADGQVARVHTDEFTIEPTGTWTSPLSGATYPSGWRLRVPDHGIDLTVRPLIESAEVDGSRSTGVVYWEGPVEASGSATGEGYVELTGYAGSLAGLF